MVDHKDYFVQSTRMEVLCRGMQSMRLGLRMSCPSRSHNMWSIGSSVRYLSDSTDGVMKSAPNQPVVKSYTWTKQKNRHKKAGHLLQQLGLEAAVEAERTKLIPYFRPGDALQITYGQSLDANTWVTTVRGVVMGMRNRSFNSSFKLLCVVEKTTTIFVFPMYSPLIKEIKVIKHNFVTSKRNRVRRAKLNYLLDRPQSAYTITDTDILLMESREKKDAALEKQEAKREKKIQKLQEQQSNMSSKKVDEN